MCSKREAADQAYARYAASRGEVLRAVAELASSDEWTGEGACDLASWLAPRWQITLREARDLVREVERLQDRPALLDALSSGSISIDQCKALAVLCEDDAGSEDVWLENLPMWSIHELEREARKTMAAKLERRDNGVYLRVRHTADERFMRGEFQLHPEDGALVLSAIESRVPKSTALRDWDHACALALVEMARGTEGSGSGDRPTVLLSVDESVLSGKAGAVASLASGGFVGPETARRLSCDARTQALYTDEAGRIIAVGKTSRDISPAQRRVVEARDGGVCTFPGCGRDAFLECHHIIHVASGGPTAIWNLQLVCWTHHKLIHEGGWSLRGDAGPNITWIRPDGSVFEPRVRVTLDTS